MEVDMDVVELRELVRTGKKVVRTEPLPESINAERALAFSKIVHDRCDNVPHDIGLILEAEVQRLKPNETK